MPHFNVLQPGLFKQLHQRRRQTNREATVAAGDSIEILSRDENGLTVTQIVDLYKSEASNQELLRKATEIPALPPSWKEHFRKCLWDPDSPK